MGNNKKKKLHKSLQLYFSKKLKKIPIIHVPKTPTPTPTTTTTTNTNTSTTSWLFSACKYPRTPSFAENRENLAAAAGDHAATLSDVDRFLFDNFRSLYINDASLENSSPPMDDSDRPIRPSDRFFVSKSASSSVVGESSSSLSVASSSTVASGDGVAVMTFSKEPYEDFRRSMQEMVEARHVEKSGPLDWDFMEELLFCYLELNDKRVHKYILRAFVDLSVSFQQGRREKGTGRRKKKKIGEGGDANLTSSSGGD